MMLPRIFLVGTLIVAAPTPVPAHHAFGPEFDANRPVLLKGKVTRVEWVNPHAWIHIEIVNDDGTTEEWMVEGGSPNSLLRLGVTRNSIPVGMVWGLPRVSPFDRSRLRAVA